MGTQALPERYRGEKVFLLPYSPSQPPFSGAEAPMEGLLDYLYRQTKEDGLLDLLFTSSGGAPSKDAFIVRLWDKPLLVAFLKPNTQEEIAPAIGYGWLHSIEASEDGAFKKASFGFSFFRKWWGTEEIREAGRLALRWWFEELGCTVLFGSTMKRNVLAQRFARELGFAPAAEIPMFFCTPSGHEDCVLIYMSREQYRKLYENTNAEAVVGGG